MRVYERSSGCRHLAQSCCLVTASTKLLPTEFSTPKRYLSLNSTPSDKILVFDIKVHLVQNQGFFDL